MYEQRLLNAKQQLTFCFLILLLLSTSGCSQPGTESESKIVFSRSVGGKVDIYAVNPDGSGLISLTSGAMDSLPVWSPDGSRIAFRRGFDIWVMDSDGSNQIRVAESSGDNPEHPLKLRWSPDSSKIAFATNMAGYQGRGTFVVNADGSNLQRTSEGEWMKIFGLPVVERHWSPEVPADWSLDGSRIALFDGRGIWVMNADGSDRRILTPDSLLTLPPSWSPDGSKIAFSAVDHEEVIGLFVMNADGSKLLRIADQLPLDMQARWQPSWSPDGSRIVFTRTNFPIKKGVDRSKLTYDIYTVNIDGSGLYRLTDDPGARNAYPVWSPRLR